MIRTRGLTKHFRSGKDVVEAVRGVDLDVAEGELVALLGPNGAGKTTTLRMLTTLLAPTAGEAVVAGADVVRHPAEVRRRIGYVGQGNGAGHLHRVRDELVVQARTYGVGRAEARRRADELMDALELTELADRRVQSLSGGQRRRLDVALGLAHRPALLFLDEPSTGLDPHSRANLWEHILRLRRETGTTLVLTTHYLDEADSMAERVVVVDRGNVIADDTAPALKARLAGDRVTVRLADDDAARAAAGAVRRATGSADVDLAGPRVVVRVADGEAVLPGLVRELDASGHVVVGAELARPTLDDVFLTLTGRSLREGDLAVAAAGADVREEVAA